LEKFGQVANLLAGTDDITKLVCFLKLHSFSNSDFLSEQCAVLCPFCLYLFSYPDSPLHFVSFTSLLSRQVASLLSRGVTRSSRCFAFSLRYVLIHKLRVVQGLARRLSYKAATLMGSLITKAHGVGVSFISHTFLLGGDL